MLSNPQLMAISETDSELSSIKRAAFLMQYHETKKIGVHCAEKTGIRNNKIPTLIFRIMLQNIIENIRIMLQKY